MKYQKIKSKQESGKDFASDVEATGAAIVAAGVYKKPVLTCYGDVRDVTLGPTPGFGESGCSVTRKPGGGSCP